MKLLMGGCLVVIILIGAVYASSTIALGQTTPTRDDEDEVVTLTGRFVVRLDGNDYLFDDGTSEIRVSGGPAWYHRLDLPLDEETTITGELSDGPPWQETPREPEIDLYSVELEDGTIITIREPGRPPWAGGPKRVLEGDDWRPGPPWWARGPKFRAGREVEDEDRRPGPPPWARGPKWTIEEPATRVP